MQLTLVGKCYITFNRSSWYSLVQMGGRDFIFLQGSDVSLFAVLPTRLSWYVTMHRFHCSTFSSFHAKLHYFVLSLGCYFCDEFNHVFRLVTHFHNICSYIGGTSAMLFLAKAMLNWRSFIDEMSSPTTSSPAGLIFMTIALAFIGKGDIGEMLVILASLLHLVLVVWFIYMSLAYQTMPGESPVCWNFKPFACNSTLMFFTVQTQAGLPTPLE